MPILARCPHCITACLVAEQHLGIPIRCSKCGRTFTVQPTVLTSKPLSTQAIASGETQDPDCPATFPSPFPGGHVEPETIYLGRSTAKLGLLALAIAVGVVSLVVVALLVAFPPR